MSYDADLDRAQARYYAGAAWSEDGCPDCGWGRGVCRCAEADRRSTQTTEDQSGELEVYGAATEDILLDSGGGDWLAVVRAVGGSLEPLRGQVGALFRGRTSYARAAKFAFPLARARARTWCSEERRVLIEIVHSLRAKSRAARARGAHQRAA